MKLPGLVGFNYIIAKGTLCSKNLFADYREREKELNKNIYKLNSISSFFKEPSFYLEEAVFIKEIQVV